MNPSAVEKQLSSIIREGPLFKRSKFLKVWEDRWLVLTTNYLFVYQDRSRKMLTDSIDLNEIKNYKSYIRKDDDVLTNCLKIRSDSNMYYLGFPSVVEKWSWVVTIERLMDFKVQGKTNYNSQQSIASKGFPSQVDFQRGAKEEGESEKLRRQLQEQEKFFENALKQKYKELNVIEDKMKKREKNYEELSAQLQATIKQEERKTRQAEANLKEAELRIQQAEQKAISLQLKIREFITENKNSNQKIKINVPPVKHEIKSSYKQDLIESMLGFSIPPKGHENVILRTEVIHESYPKQAQLHKQAQKKQSVVNETIDTLETILGYTVKPSQQFNIHLRTTAKLIPKQSQDFEPPIIASLRKQNQDLKRKLQQIRKEAVIQKVQRIVENVILAQEVPQQLYKIKLGDQFDIVESILGYSLSPVGRSSLHLKATIIKPISDLETSVNVKQLSYGPIDKVETILGHSISPSHYNNLHTNGPTKIQKNQNQKREIEDLSIRETVDILKRQLLLANQQLHEAKKQIQRLLLRIKNIEADDKDSLVKQEAQENEFDRGSYGRAQQELKSEIIALKLKMKEEKESFLEEINRIQNLLKQQESCIITIQSEKRKQKKDNFPETGHILSSSYKIDMVESMLGFSVSPNATRNVHINASTINEQDSKTQKKQSQTNDKFDATEKRHTKAEAVETILGFAISPVHYEQIYTQGAVKTQADSRGKLSDLTIQNDIIKERLIGLALNTDMFKIELERVLQELSNQKTQYETLRLFNQSTAREAERIFLENVNLKKDLNEKISAEQSLKHEIRVLTIMLKELRTDPAESASTDRKEDNMPVLNYQKTLQEQTLALAASMAQQRQLENELNTIKRKLQQQNIHFEQESQRILRLLQQKEQIISSLQAQNKKNQSTSLLAKKPLPSVGHSIRPSYQYEILESILGYTLSPSQKEKAALRTIIIIEDQSQSIQNNRKNRRQEFEKSHINNVETLLGYSIAPTNYQKIHTDGRVKGKTVESALKIQNELLMNKLAVTEQQKDQQNILFEEKSGLRITPAKIYSTNHVIRQSYKIDLIESILGQTISHDGSSYIHLQAKIADEPKQQRSLLVKSKQNVGEFDKVETVLGHTIPPQSYKQIHTDGQIQSINGLKKLMSENQMLKEHILLLNLKNQSLKDELQALKGKYSLQAELFEAEKEQSSQIFSETEAKHLQIQQELSLKLKQYQELYHQFEIKMNDIQSQPTPILISPKKEQKWQSAPTEVLKPSLLKSKSSKNDTVPVWVTVRPEDEEKPNETIRKISDVQASPPINRVSEMKKLFEGMAKSSKKE